MPEELPVFQIDLGQLDILLSSSDFYGLAAQADYHVERDPRRGMSILRCKGREHACVFLEPLLERLFSPTLAADSDAIAFLMRRPEREPRAFLVNRVFEIRYLPLREFRLPPPSLRSHLKSRGIAAIRFEGEGRIQFLLDAAALEPGKDEGSAA